MTHSNKKSQYAPSCYNTLITFSFPLMGHGPFRVRGTSIDKARNAEMKWLKEAIIDYLVENYLWNPVKFNCIHGFSFNE